MRLRPPSLRIRVSAWRSSWSWKELMGPIWSTVALKRRLRPAAFTGSPADALNTSVSPLLSSTSKEPGTQRSSRQSKPRRISSEYVTPLYQVGANLKADAEALSCRLSWGKPSYMQKAAPFWTGVKSCRAASFSEVRAWTLRKARKGLSSSFTLAGAFTSSY